MGRSFTGTFYAGPYEGQILTFDCATIQMPPPRPSMALYLTEPEPSSAPSFNVLIYHWTMDDDGRGWWLSSREQRALVNPSRPGR